MKYLFGGLAASSLALLSGSVMAHSDEAEMSSIAHQALHIGEALLPVLLMVAISIVAMPLFKKMRTVSIKQSRDK